MGKRIRTVKKCFILSLNEKSIKFKTQWAVYIFMVELKMIFRES